MIHLGTDEVKPITFLKISSLVKAKADEWFQLSVASISRRNSFLLDEWLHKLSGLPPAGPLNQQQANAVVHDPFPQNDIGPYDAASRPPSYQQPLPEAVRNRLVPDQMPWLGR